jgi:hypothetical protein
MERTESVNNRKRTRTANVSKEVLWSILDDYQSIANHTSQVKTSTLSGESETGVGAVRHCNLAPMGTTVETITGYTPGEEMTHEVIPTGLPVKSSLTTFKVTAVDENTSTLTSTAVVEAKGGFMRGFIEKRLPKAFDSLLGDIVESAEKTAEVA